MLALPPEMTLRIFSSTNNDTQDRVRFLRISRQLHAPAKVALYTNIEMRSQSSIEALVCTVARSPKLGQLCKSLVISVPRYERRSQLSAQSSSSTAVAALGKLRRRDGTFKRKRASLSLPPASLSILSYLPNMQTVSLNGCGVLQGPMQPSGVRGLELQNLDETKGWTYDALVDLLKRFRGSLVTLILRSGLPSVYSSNMIDLLGIAGASLRHLHLEGHRTVHPCLASLSAALAQCTALETLTLRRISSFSTAASSPNNEDLFSHLPLSLTSLSINDVAFLSALCASAVRFVGDASRSPLLQQVKLAATDEVYSWAEKAERMREACKERGIAFDGKEADERHDPEWT